MRTPRSAIAALVLAGPIVGVAQAQEPVFGLGKLNDVVTVIGEAPDADLTDNKITIEDVWTFKRNTLDEAIKLVPGVTSTLDGTARRNERGIYVRGFGRWQVPLSIDGIRIYLPADNRLDFNRFLTQDLSEIEVQKGYVSVLDGPGGMGGAINLITRTPADSFDTELRAGAGEGVEDAYLRIGSLHESFYVQGSVSYLDREYWDLSDDFVPTSIENLLAELYRATGEKGAPLHVFNSPPNPPNSYWRWPTWDIGNLYWLSVTRFGADYDVMLKTTLFNNRYENSLYAYDNATYTTQSLPGRSKASTTTWVTAAASRSSCRSVSAIRSARRFIGGATSTRRYEPSESWSITPSVELASDRWSDVTGGGYVRIGDYTLLNLQAQYRGSDVWEMSVGGTNLTDEDFQLAYGYPEPGRSAYLRLRLNF